MLLLSGELIDAAGRPMRIGLAERVVAPGEVLAAVTALAGRSRRNPRWPCARSSGWSTRTTPPSDEEARRIRGGPFCPHLDFGGPSGGARRRARNGVRPIFAAAESCRRFRGNYRRHRIDTNGELGIAEPRRAAMTAPAVVRRGRAALARTDRAKTASPPRILRRASNWTCSTRPRASAISIRLTDIGLPGEISFHPRRAADDVSRAAVDDAPVQRLRHAEGIQPALQMAAEQGQTGISVALDLPTQLGLDSDDPAGDRRCWPRRRGDRHAGRHGDAVRRNSARSHQHLIYDQFDRRDPARDVLRRWPSARGSCPTRSPARFRTTSSRNTSRAAPGFFRPSRRCA